MVPQEDIFTLQGAREGMDVTYSTCEYAHCIFRGHMSTTDRKQRNGKRRPVLRATGWMVLLDMVLFSAFPHFTGECRQWENAGLFFATAITFP
jgi:hypothetical protein